MTKRRFSFKYINSYFIKLRNKIFTIFKIIKYNAIFKCSSDIKKTFKY
jgi:hypothetical protein